MSLSLEFYHEYIALDLWFRVDISSLKKWYIYIKPFIIFFFSLNHTYFETKKVIQIQNLNKSYQIQKDPVINAIGQQQHIHRNQVGSNEVKCMQTLPLPRGGLR